MASRKREREDKAPAAEKKHRWCGERSMRSGEEKVILHLMKKVPQLSVMPPGILPHCLDYLTCRDGHSWGTRICEVSNWCSHAHIVNYRHKAGPCEGDVIDVDLVGDVKSGDERSLHCYSIPVKVSFELLEGTWWQILHPPWEPSYYFRPSNPKDKWKTYMSMLATAIPSAYPVYYGQRDWERVNILHDPHRRLIF